MICMYFYFLSMSMWTSSDVDVDVDVDVDIDVDVDVGFGVDADVAVVSGWFGLLTTSKLFEVRILLYIWEALWAKGFSSANGQI